ncbi:MAG: class I SAM-dependent methyltransferase [Cyanobacteria bacterium J06621_15]
MYTFSLYDKRNYSTVDVLTGYKKWSSTYDETVDSELDIPLLTNLKTVPWSKINKVLDLGCGTGRIGQWLKNQGISDIYGIDNCSAMLEHSYTKNIYTNLDIGEITQTSLPLSSYDLIVTSLTVCHLPNLNALYTEVVRILKPGGLFVLIDYHPFFLLEGVPTNFDENGESIAIENFVHLFSDHINSGCKINLKLLEMQERVVDSKWVEQKPGMGKYINQPISFCMVWEKEEQYQ